jgi:hypothetical protein
MRCKYPKYSSAFNGEIQMTGDFPRFKSSLELEICVAEELLASCFKSQNILTEVLFRIVTY